MPHDEKPEPFADDEEDFASMLEQSSEPQSYRQGEMVEGRIVSVSRDVAFVDIGGKGEATIDLEELLDADGDLDVEVGDFVQAVVVSTQGGLKLSHKLARGAANLQALGDAYRAGLPVEGRVEKAIKGGFEVRVGGQRAFCPISQIDKGYTDDPSIHEGQNYTFRITEFDEQRKNLVVSRRALIEEEEQEQAAVVRKTIVPGADLPGRVASVQNYGAFVDLGGGIQGLLHVSEMGWSRISDPGSVVQPGDEIIVKVLSVDEAKGRIALGLKQLQSDPWTSAEDTYEVGQLLSGKVTRVAEFGAFVELEPGIEGLAHASTFPPSGKRDAWREQIQPGDVVAVKLLSFEPERKRIGVAVIDEAAIDSRGADAVSITTGATLTGKVERHESFGVFVFLAPGRSGLIPLAETGVERGVDLRKALPEGSDVTVVVLEIEPDGRRIRLSRKAVFEAEQRKLADEYASRQQGEVGDGFGSLADQLRQAMDPKKSG